MFLIRVYCIAGRMSIALACEIVSWGVLSVIGIGALVSTAQQVLRTIDERMEIRPILLPMEDTMRVLSFSMPPANSLKRWNRLARRPKGSLSISRRRKSQQTAGRRYRGYPRYVATPCSVTGSFGAVAGPSP